jgi:hypothetical protein
VGVGIAGNDNAGDRPGQPLEAESPHPFREHPQETP